MFCIPYPHIKSKCVCKDIKHFITSKLLIHINYYFNAEICSSVFSLIPYVNLEWENADFMDLRIDTYQIFSVQATGSWNTTFLSTWAWLWAVEVFICIPVQVTFYCDSTTTKLKPGTKFFFINVYSLMHTFVQKYPAFPMILGEHIYLTSSQWF